MLLEARATSSGSGPDSAQLSSITTYAGKFVKAKCPSCTFADFKINSAFLPKLPFQAAAELTSHPDTNYVLTQIDPFTPPVLQALATTGLQSKVKVIGTGPLPDTLLTLQKGGSPLVAESGISQAYETWPSVSRSCN